MRLAASRFVRGETLDEVVEVIRGLNEKGLRADTTPLGEDVRDTAEARAVTDRYEEILRRLRGENLDANVALKLTHLGLAVDEELAHENLARLLALAGELGSFVRIDMEASRYVDPTRRINRRRREGAHDAVGVVLREYLPRREDDLRGSPLRTRVAPVPDAPAGRAPGECSVLPAEPGPAMRMLATTLEWLGTALHAERER